MVAVDAERYVGRTAVDPSGQTIGSISRVFRHDRTGRMDWISVTTGLFGQRDNYAPLKGSRCEGDNVVLIVDKQLVMNSPNSVTIDHLTAAERTALTTYYLPFLRTVPPESATTVERLQPAPDPRPRHRDATGAPPAPHEFSDPVGTG